MTDDGITLYGKPRKHDRRFIRMWADLVENHVDQKDLQSLISTWSMIRLQRVMHWLKDNDIRDDELTLNLHSFWRAAVNDTSVLYNIYFEKDEHRTLFLLSKDNILETEITFT
jgi:hypothetical protein